MYKISVKLSFFWSIFSIHWNFSSRQLSVWLECTHKNSLQIWTFLTSTVLILRVFFFFATSLNFSPGRNAYLPNSIWEESSWCEWAYLFTKYCLQWLRFLPAVLNSCHFWMPFPRAMQAPLWWGKTARQRSRKAEHGRWGYLSACLGTVLCSWSGPWGWIDWGDTEWPMVNIEIMVSFNLPSKVGSSESQD